LILGDMSVQGQLKPLRSLAEPLRIAMDNGAKRALVPIENKRMRPAPRRHTAAFGLKIFPSARWCTDTDPIRAGALAVTIPQARPSDRSFHLARIAPDLHIINNKRGDQAAPRRHTES
jgi:hypothetical protein